VNEFKPLPGGPRDSSTAAAAEARRSGGSGRGSDNGSEHFGVLRSSSSGRMSYMSDGADGRRPSYMSEGADTVTDADTFTEDDPLSANVLGRGLHSSTFWLNVSAFCGIGVTFGGCVGGAYEVWAVLGGCLACIWCQKRLRLS